MAEPRTLFHGGRVFDAASASLAAADVVVADGRVLEVGPGLDGDVAVDCAGSTVLPGLFDCHVHVAITHFDTVRWLSTPQGFHHYEAIATLRDYLAMGITTVRDAGGADAALRLALSRGLVAGPRLRIAVTMLSQTGGHGDPMEACGTAVPFLPAPVSGVVDGADDVRRKVRELVRAGADQIKVAVSGGVLSPLSDPRRPHLSPAELQVMVAEAAAAGLDVMAHAHGAAGIVNGVRAGVRSIEHGTMLSDEAIGPMLEHGTWLVPTLLAPQGVIDAHAAGVRCRTWCSPRRGPSWTCTASPSPAPSKPGCGSPWAPTARSPRTAPTSGSCCSWRAAACRPGRCCRPPRCPPPG